MAGIVPVFCWQCIQSRSLFRGHLKKKKKKKKKKDCYFLKGVGEEKISTNFTNKSVFEGFGESHCICIHICEKSSIMLFVAPDEAACNLIKSVQWKGGISGSAVFTSNICPTVYRRAVFYTYKLLFKTWHLNYPECNSFWAKKGFTLHFST